MDLSFLLGAEHGKWCFCFKKDEKRKHIDTKYVQNKVKAKRAGKEAKERGENRNGKRWRNKGPKSRECEMTKG